jgi:hypothetical protein
MKLNTCTTLTHPMGCLLDSVVQYSLDSVVFNCIENGRYIQSCV